MYVCRYICIDIVFISMFIEIGIIMVELQRIVDRM